MNTIGYILMVTCLLLLLYAALGGPPHPLLWGAICGVAGLLLVCVPTPAWFRKS